MDVILMERVPKLGQMGEVVGVRAGFARNFLIPKGKAMRATKSALEDFERRRTDLEARNLEMKEEAEKLGRQIQGRSITVLRQASETGSLYGSVSARDAVEGFAETGVKLDRGQVMLDQPIKTLGVHEVVLALHPEVEVTVTVNVARSKEEAEIQAGKAPPPPDDEEEEDEARTLEEELDELIR